MRALAVTVGLVILLAAVKAASSVFVPLLLAATLAIAFQPVGEWLSRRGLPPAATAAATLLGVLAVVAVTAGIAIIAVADLGASLPRYQTSLAALQADAVHWLGDRGLYRAANEVAAVEPSGKIATLLQDGLIGASGFLSTLFLVLVITIFIQLEATTYRRKLVRVLGSPRPVRKGLEALGEVQRYMGVKTLLSLANGVLLGLWCWLWGVPNPLLWGVIAFLLNYIPVVGSIIAAVPPVFIAFVEQGFGGAAVVAAGYGAVNLVVDNMLEPRIMGRALGLSPLVVLASMLVWGFVLGPVGALLSVPLTMAMKIVLEHDEDLRWIAMLIGDASEMTTPPVPAPAPPDTSGQVAWPSEKTL
jgi:predicted PurR-regulated permease PerM